MSSWRTGFLLILGTFISDSLHLYQGRSTISNRWKRSLEQWSRITSRDKEIQLFLRQFRICVARKHYPCTDKEHLLSLASIVLAWQKSTLRGTRVPYLFRTYRHPRTGHLLERNPDHIDNYPIWQIGRATSAAPTYFKATKIREDDDKFEFVDGGFGTNNPSEEVYRSVTQMCNNNRTAVKTLVSIGTGKNDEIVHLGRGYQKYLSYLNAAVKWASDSERIHETVYSMTQGNTDYFRLNVEEGIGSMKLDAWKGKHGSKTLQQLINATEAYLSTDAAQQLLRDSAQALVQTRRARAYHADADYQDHWERFCHGVEYACGHPSCTAERHTKRRALKRHLEGTHHIQDRSEIERLLEAGKRYPLYE